MVVRRWDVIALCSLIPGRIGAARTSMYMFGRPCEGIFEERGGKHWSDWPAEPQGISFPGVRETNVHVSPYEAGMNETPMKAWVDCVSGMNMAGRDSSSSAYINRPYSV